MNVGPECTSTGEPNAWPGAQSTVESFTTAIAAPLMLHVAIDEQFPGAHGSEQPWPCFGPPQLPFAGAASVSDETVDDIPSIFMLGDACSAM